MKRRRDQRVALVWPEMMVEDLAQIGERLDAVELDRLDHEAVTAQLSATPSEPAKR
jgi:hypothetical protein